MNLAPPIPRLERPRREPIAKGDDRTTANRTPVKSRAGAVRRERHQADYVILVVVVALTAVGILMVYSSSALKGYLSQDADTFATVGPQIQWAILGIVAMLLMMRVDYRYLRLVSVPFYLFAIVLLVLVFVPSLNIVVGGSARWLKLGPLPAIHPAEIAKLALVIYLAHWFAKRGSGIRGFWGGTVPFLIIVTPILVLVFKEPDLGTTGVITLTAFTMFFVAGANIMHLAVMAAGGAMAMIVVGLRGYQMQRILVWQDPWLDRLGAGFHTVQGLLALGVGGLLGTGLGGSRVSVPNAFNDFIFAEVGQEFGMLGRDRRDRPVPPAGLLGDPHRAVGARHVRGVARGRDHRLDLSPGVRQHRGGRGAAADHRDHPAVHQRRRVIPHHQLCRDRDPVIDLARDRGEGDVERRCDC